MRVRTLLLIGVAIALVGTVVGAGVVLLADNDAGGDALVAALLSFPTVIALMTLLGFLAGWFGREGADLAIVGVGFGAGAVVVLSTALFVVSPSLIALGMGALVGLGLAVAAAVAGQAARWLGNTICSIRGLPTLDELVMPAYPEEYPGAAPWTTTAGPTLRATLDRLAERVSSGADVRARAIGILVRLPRDLPVAVVLVAEQLALEPIDLEGRPTGEPIVVKATDLTSVSMRSVAADGSIRRRINAYDDTIDIGRPDGSTLRLRLPYGTRGAGTRTGGPDEIRSWLRTSAATYD